MREIGEYFGLDVPLEKIERVLGVDAKDPDGVRPFRFDSASKQASATPLVKVAAFEWAEPGYAEMKKRR